LGVGVGWEGLGPLFCFVCCCEDVFSFNWDWIFILKICCALVNQQDKSYKIPSFEAICESLVRKKDKLLHLGVIFTIGTCTKSLVAQWKNKSKCFKKKNRCKNKYNKGTKTFQWSPTPNGDNWTKSKGKKTKRNCNCYGQDCHIESKYLKKMEALKVALKKQNINLDSSSSRSSWTSTFYFLFFLQWNILFLTLHL